MEVKFLDEGAYVEKKVVSSIKTRERSEKTIFWNAQLLSDLDGIMKNLFTDKYRYPDDGEFHNQVSRLFLNARHIGEKFQAVPIYLDYADYVFKLDRMVKLSYEIILIGEEGKDYGKISVSKLTGRNSKEHLKTVKTGKEALEVAIKDIEKFIGGKIEDNKE